MIEMIYTVLFIKTYVRVRVSIPYVTCLSEGGENKKLNVQTILKT